MKNFSLLSLILGVCALNSNAQIRSKQPVILPLIGQSDFIVQSSQTTTVFSSQSVTLKPGFWAQAGSNVIIGIDNLLVDPAPSNPSADLNRNWILTKSYDEDGNESGATKNFFDDNGKLQQTQVKNESSGHVLANQTIYDLQNRAVVNTLTAPTNNSAFAYKAAFVTNKGNDYSFKNFDGELGGTGKVNSPDPVDNNVKGTLGWYYSNNNTFESLIAATAFPYSRSNYFRDGSTSAKAASGIGESLRMGSGHEINQTSSPVIHELDNYVSIRSKFFSGSAVGSAPANMAGHALQNIVKDENGMQMINVTDLAGNTLMTARADVQGWLTVNNSFTLTASPNNYEAYITTGGANAITSFSVQCKDQMFVYQNGAPIFYNTGDLFAFSSISDPPGGANYIIRSENPFTFSCMKNGNNVVSNASAQYKESPTTSLQYFNLLNPGSVSIVGGGILYEMQGETNITESTGNGNILPAGYYKLIVNPGYTTTTLSYSNSFSDISYNYYNQLGQIIATIAPNGVKELIDHPENYNSTSPIPFATIYEYDLQGRLIASKSTDGGRSEFVYRQDGKIRFSQNAEQRKAANGGRFSYTNYDEVGRPFESGEYVPQSGSDLQFSSLANNITLLEEVSSTGGLTGGLRQDHIKTHYDLADNSHGIGGYVQDEGFLRGAVSWTENANAKTWYNYDGQGRVAWMIRQITGLGNKTLNYTYDGKGNVTIVDYQRETAGERFLHYYDYDLDGKLVNVKTSRDDVNKLQHAKYYYYLHGPLKRVELGDNLQGIDYVYTAQGMLKSINHASGDPNKDPNQDGLVNSFAPDAFGLQMDYFPGDYSRNGVNIGSIITGQPTYYNGNVNSISWQGKTTVAGPPAPATYSYNYDKQYQLNSATWGTPNFANGTFNQLTKFQERNLSYDPNGNIKTLQRTDVTGNISDDFNSYQYQVGTNKLLTVGNGSATYGNYTYDDLGQLKSAQQAGVGFGMYLKYDVSGKITGIYADAALSPSQLKMAYNYDESGNRISSINYTGSSPITTNYVYDPSGNVLAIYSNTILTELPLYGSDRLGNCVIASDIYAYELKDNVGSVRVVIKRDRTSSGGIDVLTYNDYYPYGSIAQNGGIGYRYEYQGAYAEKDPVTKWNNFDLRMYDGRIGRWLSTDPKNIGYSPFNGMNNNPVTSIDRDGGEPENQGINKYGKIIYDDKKHDGNIFLINEGYSKKITSLDQLTANSTQIAKNSVWIGSDELLKTFYAAQWKHGEGGFDGYLDLISLSNIDIMPAPEGRSGGIAVAPYSKDDNKSGANTRVITNPRDLRFKIYNSRGQPNVMLQDVYNVINAIAHEKKHLYQALLYEHLGPHFMFKLNRIQWELGAIEFQKSVPSYRKSSSDWKQVVDLYKSEFNF